MILHCEAKENERSLVRPGRGSDTGNGKLTDAKVLRECRNREGIWTFGDDDEFEVDGTSTSAAEMAERVAKFVQQREKDGRSQSEW